MKNFRIYGKTPFRVALLHGGPGAPGGMAPVARELSSKRGVLEPLQTADSVAGQVEELHSVLAANAEVPIVLVGSSWGAMLGFIFTANYPDLVHKLILVGSGVFEAKYAAQIMATRMNRLTVSKRAEVAELQGILSDPAIPEKNAALSRFGKIFTRTDAYNPFTLETETLPVQFDVHQKVWQEAVESRKSGQLLALGKQIQCPVVAIHGDYDPHPAEGIEKPLSTVLKNFRFILLSRCGHLPWIEREASDEFYDILNIELGGPTVTGRN